MNVTVTVGKSDDGKEVGQWIRVACFGETAEKIAAVRKRAIAFTARALDTEHLGGCERRHEDRLEFAAWKVEQARRHRQKPPVPREGTRAAGDCVQTRCGVLRRQSRQTGEKVSP